MDFLGDIDRSEYFFTDALNDHDFLHKSNHSLELHSIDCKIPQIGDILEKFELDNSK